jgi:hypothetical protein
MAKDDTHDVEAAEDGDAPLLDLNDAYVHVHVYVRIGDAEKYKHVRRYVHRVCTGTHTQEL